MKKLFLVMTVLAFGFSTSAQNFGGGIGVGIPTGDSGDFLSFSINADLNYTWNVSDNSWRCGVCETWSGFSSQNGWAF